MNGSTIAATDSTGTRTATWTYDPYGNISAHTGTATTPYTYAGEYTDTDTGLIYLRARYDPTTASFTTRDPLENLTGTPYTYTNGNPLQSSDPTGMFLNGVLGDIGQYTVKTDVYFLNGFTFDYSGKFTELLSSGPMDALAKWGTVPGSCPTAADKINKFLAERRAAGFPEGSGREWRVAPDRRHAGSPATRLDLLAIPRPRVTRQTDRRIIRAWGFLVKLSCCTPSRITVVGVALLVLVVCSASLREGYAEARAKHSRETSR